MANQVKFSITQTGVDSAINRMIKVSGRPSQYALQTIARETAEHINSHFDPGNPLGWKALKPSTIRSKSRGLGGFAAFANPARILWRTGRLGRGTKGIVEGGNSVRLENPYGYGIFSQRGTKYMVKRAWMVVQQTMRERIKQILLTR